MNKQLEKEIREFESWKTKSKPSKTEHSVFVQYGLTKFKLSANALQLIADALEIVNPDTEKQTRLARKLATSFSALAEYAESVE